MENEKVTSLAGELRVSEDLARMAINESEGELEKAREILDGIIPKYLIIKAKFVSPKPTGGSGLILIIVKKGIRRFELFRTVYDSNRDWAENVQVHHSPDIILRIIKGYFQTNDQSARLFDAEKLRKSLKPIQENSAIQYLFELWDRPKAEIDERIDPTLVFDSPGPILTALLQDTLGDALVDKVQVRLDYDFYTESGFQPIAAVMGMGDSKSGEAQTGQNDGSKALKVVLKGQFLIDPAQGELVQDLEIGDQVFCEIIDKSEIAITVAKLIGGYRRGLWLPLKGTVTEIRDSVGERKMFTLVVADGVSVIILTMQDIRVRTRDLITREIVQAAEDVFAETSLLPILIGVSMLAFLILTLFVLR